MMLIGPARKALFYFLPPETSTEPATTEIWEMQGGYHPHFNREGDAFKHLFRLATDALPQLKKSKNSEAELDGWYIQMRPILASHRSCLNCHAGAKTGETLGVMVYAVRKSQPKADT